MNPNNNLPDESCLLLRVWSEPYQVECDNTWYPDPYQGEAECRSGFMVLKETGKPLTKSLSNGIPAMIECSCHGTGTRTVRLVGVVPVEYGANTYGVWDIEPPIIHSLDESVHDQVVRRWKDDTLPDEVREGLKEVSCD
jgi:hypothetical protein